MALSFNSGQTPDLVSRIQAALDAGDAVVIVERGDAWVPARSCDDRPFVFGCIPDLAGPGWERAFTDEADAEIRAMFDPDDDLGVDAPKR
ncbi:hypothetical protein [Aeromicrobium alkaliterrae]|uniref:Prevent-host-death protein n=1 Tax=Aeromicrobium alkaliterrae TaxID=302168 RepID=A0ABN2JP48_9ACTN